MFLPGEKALTAYGLHPKLHAISRRPFSKALSPNAVLETQPYLNAIVERKILQLEGFAKRGQVGVNFSLMLNMSTLNLLTSKCKIVKVGHDHVAGNVLMSVPEKKKK